MSVTFGERLLATFGSSGHLCVGIDPHPYLLDAWDLADSAAGVRDFGLRVVEASAGRVGILKPQVAFFERHGSAGFAALEEVLAAGRAAGLIVIADAKRGDLGTSVEAYGQAWLTPGSTLEADAMTLSAYQGVGSLAAPIALARDTGKGVFILAATSNPESFALQTAHLMSPGGPSVAASIVEEVNSSNAQESGAAGLGSAGVVIGATVSLPAYGIAPASLQSTPILGPGFGHQGTTYDALFDVYGAAGRNVVVSSSRAILEAGPAGLERAIDAEVARLAEAFAV